MARRERAAEVARHDLPQVGDTEEPLEVHGADGEEGEIENREEEPDQEAVERTSLGERARDPPAAEEAHQGTHDGSVPAASPHRELARRLRIPRSEDRDEDGEGQEEHGLREKRAYDDPSPAELHRVEDTPTRSARPRRTRPGAAVYNAGQTMTTRGFSPVPVDLGSASTDTEENRAFFQDRLRLYTGWVFVLAFGFYFLSAANALAVSFNFLVERTNAFHGLACATVGVVWIMMKTRHWPWKGLLIIDGVTIVSTCVWFSAMGASLALEHVSRSVDPLHAILIGQLACMSTVLTRAIALPSSPLRTFWLGVLSFLPQMVFSGYALSVSGSLPSAANIDVPLDAIAMSNFVNIVGWCGVGLAISTVGSRVIFGLRIEANKVKRLGQYTLEEKIGEGGMGIVYRASHAMLRRPTAIKLLPPEKAGEDSIRRFEREVQLTATLSHPSTVAIFDYGRTPTGVFYYAMEYLQGLNLEELVRSSGPQEPGRVIHILAQVSGALTEAHEAGLIHRDIKPANIILCQRGGIPDVAKVVDFGLVKAVVADETAETVMVTGQHVLAGTPLYIAPEAIKGEQFVDGRSDLYALGAVGYYLLTGEPPFPSGNVVEVVAHHLHTVPEPPSQRGARDIPHDLEAIVMRCLEKAPDDRFSTARDLARALSQSAISTPWSLDRADELWTAGSAAHEGRDRPTPADSLPTMAVDIGDRISSVGSP